MGAGSGGLGSRGQQWTGLITFERRVRFFDVSSTSTLKLSVHVKILFIFYCFKQVYYCRSGTSPLQICTRVCRAEHLVILPLISRTN